LNLFHENETPYGVDAKDQDVAKSQREGSKEIRKPKKEAPPRQNASKPLLKGIDGGPKG